MSQPPVGRKCLRCERRCWVITPGANASRFPFDVRSSREQTRWHQSGDTGRYLDFILISLVPGLANDTNVLIRRLGYETAEIYPERADCAARLVVLTILLSVGRRACSHWQREVTRSMTFDTDSGSLYFCGSLFSQTFFILPCNTFSIEQTVHMHAAGLKAGTAE